MRTRWIPASLLALALLAPAAAAEEDEGEGFLGLPRESTYGVCTAYEASGRGQRGGGDDPENGTSAGNETPPANGTDEGNQTSAGNETAPGNETAQPDEPDAGNETGEPDEGLGPEDADPFQWLEQEAQEDGQSTQEYCAQNGQRPGPPEDVPGQDRPGQGPDDRPDGPPDETPDGPPEETPDGPPEETPDRQDDAPAPEQPSRP